MTKDKLKTVTEKDLSKWVEGETFEFVVVPGMENLASVKLLTQQYKDLVVVYDNIKILKEEGENLPRLVFDFLLPELSIEQLPRYQNSKPFKETISAVLTASINDHFEVIDNLPTE